MRSSRSLLLLLALGVAGWWWVQSRPAPRMGSGEEPASVEQPTPMPTDPPTVESERAPVRTTLAPMQVPGCPTLEAEPIGPSLADSANLLTGELWDRARAILNGGSDASPELSDGLRTLARGDGERALPLLRDAPDRVQDGFDHASAAAFADLLRVMGQEGDVDAALARLAAVDDEGLAQMGRALVARQRGDTAAELDALTHAFQLRDDPALAFALASTAARTGDSPWALEAMDRYLESYGDDEWAVAMRPLLARRAALERPMREVARDGIVLRHARSFDHAQAVALLDQVIASLDDAAALLGESRRSQLTVLVYADREDYRSATCGPSWSGALFDGSLRLNGATHPRALPIAVRHESLHAQLAAVAPRAPLWLHEGLAQHFQGHTPPALERTLELMAREGTYVPFPSLEGSFVVIEDGQSARFAYHQSYAMVAAILDREGQGALRRAVAHLKKGGDPRDTLQGMTTREFTGDDLLAWIASRSE